MQPVQHLIDVTAARFKISHTSEPYFRRMPFFDGPITLLVGNARFRTFTTSQFGGAADRVVKRAVSRWVEGASVSTGVYGLSVGARLYRCRP